MKRKITVILSVLAILVCCAVPALGASAFVPIWDTLYSVEPMDGSTTYVFAFDEFLYGSEWYVTDSFGQLVSSGTGSTIEFPGAEDERYSVYFRLPDTLVDSHVFPVGSEFALEVGYQMRFAHDNDSISGSVSYFHVNSSGVIIGEDVYAMFADDVNMAPDDDEPMHSVLYAYEKGFYFELCLRVQTLSEGNKMLELNWCDFYVTVDDGEFSRNLDQQIVDKIDQIINGEVPPPRDPSGGLGDAYDDAEQEVIDKVETGRDEIENIIDEFSVYLEEFLPGIVVVSNWLNILLELKFIRVLLFFSLAFGMCGLFLGVANSFRGKS